jgi:MFS transporter, CP family, cyanate transporter
VDGLGLALAPGTTAVFDALSIGVGLGGGFAMGFILISDSTRSRSDAARLGAMVFLFGYGIASVGPLAVGWLHDVTGGFRVGYLTMAAVSVMQLVVVVQLRHGRHIGDEGQRDPRQLDVCGTTVGETLA